MLLNRSKNAEDGLTKAALSAKALQSFKHF
jgi:hypothetical protein